jgi:TRAP-type C4-dicarboxylate transport system substrate-binding protein
MKAHTLLGAALAAVLLLSFVMVSPQEAAAQEGEVYTMSFQTVAPKRTPWARQLNRLKKHWEKESGGRLKIKVFLGRGNEKALVRKCKAGELQAVGVSTAAMADEVPEMGVFELPYLFSSADQADKVIDNHLFEPVGEILRENGFQILLFTENGYRNFATKGKVIKSPEDLATLKMRTQENWIHEETYKALGGNPVRISVAEVLTSLSTNQVNGFDNTPLFAFATSWFSQIDTWTVSDHIYQPAVVVFNKKWFDSLPPDLQKILTDVRAKETPKGRRAVRGLTPKLLEKLGEKGVTIYRMTPQEKAAFAKKTRGVHQQFRKKVGAKGAKLLDLIEKNK